MNILAEDNPNAIEIEELDKENQIYGDIGVWKNEKRAGQKAGFTVEVKYDIMAEKTGNLCFEASNGKKATGILSTQADEVWYVVPDGTNFNVYKFITKQLVDFLNDPINSDKIKVVNGGDRRKFILMLVKKDIAKDLISYDMVEVLNA